jgi:hypothetical protein
MTVLRSPLRPVLRSPLYHPLVGKWGSGYEPEAEALFARFTTPATLARKTLINDMIKALKSAGVWTKMDALHVMAAADNQAARRNWIADAFNLSAVSSPTFEADRGFTPDGSTSYLDTGFNPTTASGPKFTPNSAHMGAWHRTNLANAGAESFDVGGTNSRMSRLNTGSTAIRPNTSSNQSMGGGTFAQNKTWNRSASNAWQFYRSGAADGTGTTASIGAASYTFRVGNAQASSYGVNQASIFHFGESLTAGEVAAMHTAFSAYMSAVGAA